MATFQFSQIMRINYIPILILLSSCTESISLEKRTATDKTQPYVISIVDPIGSKDYMHQLCDSLDQHISRINKTGLGEIVKDQQGKDAFYGWLQKQFDDEYSGIGLKAPSEIAKDRTSDETRVENGINSEIDKFSFTADFRIDSIPKEFLYPELWKKAVSNKQYEERIRSELTGFVNGGRLIREKNGIKDTLFAYTYTMPIDIILNYYISRDKSWTKSKFTLVTRTAVYHQLKFK